MALLFFSFSSGIQELIHGVGGDLQTVLISKAYFRKVSYKTCHTLGTNTKTIGRPKIIPQKNSGINERRLAASSQAPMDSNMKRLLTYLRDFLSFSSNTALTSLSH
jgi:hypothetical protein